MHRTYEYRNNIITSIKLSYTYKGLHDDPSILILDSILNDYLKNGIPYINKEIDIVNCKKITSSHHDKNTLYKFFINLYNDNNIGDSFTIEPISPIS